MHLDGYCLNSKGRLSVDVTSICRLTVYKNSSTKIVVILTSVILLAGMLFVPAKQIVLSF
jgi:hypothetical protein